jgi:hypothetical protein
MKSWRNIIRVLGVATCLIGAFLMAWREPIVGINHTGIATIVGITGIGIISTANKTSLLGTKKAGK